MVVMDGFAIYAMSVGSHPIEPRFDSVRPNVPKIRTNERRVGA